MAKLNKYVSKLDFKTVTQLGFIIFSEIKTKPNSRTVNDPWD